MEATSTTAKNLHKQHNMQGRIQRGGGRQGIQTPLENYKI